MRPIFSSFQTSSVEGLSISGGAMRQHLTQNCAVTLECLREFAVFHRIVARKFCELRGGFGWIRKQQQAMAIRRKREQANVRMNHREAVLLEFHVANDFGD